MTTDFVFTSGSVTKGHPDKLCDGISDAIVDACLIQDPASRVVTESAVSGGVIFISQRAHTEATVDLADTARAAVIEAGYTTGEFNARDCSVMISQADLSGDAALRLDLAALSSQQREAIVAGHQVTLFGYACRQTPQFMPLPVMLAHHLARRLDQIVADGELPYLGPDGQAQVGVIYRDRQPVGIHTIAIQATQHQGQVAKLSQLRRDLREYLIEPEMEIHGIPLDQGTQFLINPENSLVTGGPTLHAGLTGRKTGIDSYGEYARHSGAALSGKDPLRIDRIGAYAARHAAKNLVAAGLADECELQLSYVVGQARPVGLRVETFGTGTLDDAELAERVCRVFDFRPGIIAHDYCLQTLPAERQGFFYPLTCYGQMGRDDLDAPWERLDRVNALKD